MGARKITGEIRMFILEALAMGETGSDIKKNVQKNFGVSLCEQTIYNFSTKNKDRIEKTRTEMERSFRGIAHANVYTRIKTRDNLIKKIQDRIEKKENKNKPESILSDARTANIILDSIQREFVVINELHAKDVYYDVLEMTQDQFHTWMESEYEGMNLQDIVPQVIFPEEKSEIRQAREEIKKEISGNEQYQQHQAKRATVIALPTKKENRGRPRKYFPVDGDEENLQERAISVSKRRYGKKKTGYTKITQRKDAFREKFLKQKITSPASHEKNTGTDSE